MKSALQKTKKRSDDLVDAVRGIQRGLDAMKAGTGKPFRVALDEIRTKHKNPRSSRHKTHQTWVDESLAGGFKPGGAARLRTIAARARAEAK